MVKATPAGYKFAFSRTGCLIGRKREIRFRAFFFFFFFFSSETAVRFFFCTGCVLVRQMYETERGSFTNRYIRIVVGDMVHKYPQPFEAVSDCNWACLLAGDCLEVQRPYGGCLLYVSFVLVRFLARF